MTINWETILIALIQAIATVGTAWIERTNRCKSRPSKKGAKLK